MCDLCVYGVEHIDPSNCPSAHDIGNFFNLRFIFIYFPLSSFPASQMMNLAAAAPATVAVAFKILNTVLIVSTSCFLCYIYDWFFADISLLFGCNEIIYWRIGQIRGFKCVYISWKMCAIRRIYKKRPPH